MKVIREDAKKEWKPNLNYKHIKDVLDNALSRGKYINNEREEVKAALDLCDKKQKYTPEQRKFIQDSHREMWKKNRRVSEGRFGDAINAFRDYVNGTDSETTSDNPTDVKRFRKGLFNNKKKLNGELSQEEYNNLPDMLTPQQVMNNFTFVNKDGKRYWGIEVSTELDGELLYHAWGYNDSLRDSTHKIYQDISKISTKFNINDADLSVNCILHVVVEVPSEYLNPKTGSITSNGRERLKKDLYNDLKNNESKLKMVFTPERLKVSDWSANGKKIAEVIVHLESISKEYFNPFKSISEDLLPDEVFDDVVKHGKWTYVVGLYSSIKHPPEYTYHYEINTEKGVYTKVPNGYGFIAHWLLQSYPQDSMEEMEEEAQSLIKKYGCKEVPFEEYKEMIDGKKPEEVEENLTVQEDKEAFEKEFGK